MSELLKLLDNQEILDRNSPKIPVGEEVRLFVNFFFRESTSKDSHQKVLHQDVLRLLLASKFKGYIVEEFGQIFVSEESTYIDNYWTKVLLGFQNNKPLVQNLLGYYRKVYSLSGKGDLLRFLESEYFSGSIPTERLSALLTIHILGIKAIKDSLC